jgi:hypothetical protein
MLQRVMARKSWWGRLALFALALQLYLSFGHIHPEDLGISAAVQATGATHASGGTPSTPDDDDHGICSICAAVSLTSHSLMPAPVALALPVATEWTWSHLLPSPRLTYESVAYFHARAPPSA